MYGESGMFYHKKAKCPKPGFSRRGDVGPGRGGHLMMGVGDVLVGGMQGKGRRASGGGFRRNCGGGGAAESREGKNRGVQVAPGEGFGVACGQTFFPETQRVLL